MRALVCHLPVTGAFNKAHRLPRFALAVTRGAKGESVFGQTCHPARTA